MRVVATTDRTAVTHDCKVHNDISIVEKFGIYAVVVIERIEGVLNSSNARILKVTNDISEAFSCFSEHGGCDLVGIKMEK